MGRLSLRVFAGMLVAALAMGACQPAHLSTHPGQPEQVIQLTVKRFQYTPSEIKVKKGVPVVLEFTSLDRTHGFLLKAFGINEDIKKGRVTRIRFTPDKVGRFEFHCDVYCGDNHEDMEGTMIVEA